MRQRFADWSLQTKLVLITMLIVLAATGTTLIFLQRQASDARNEQFVQRALAQTRLIAEYVVSPLVFDDDKGAGELLAKLLRDPSVAYARVDDAKGAIFANARQPNTAAVNGAVFDDLPRDAFDATWKTAGDMLHVVAPIQQKGVLGRLYVGYRLADLQQAVVAERRLLILVMIGVIVASYLLAIGLQRAIAGPLVRLSQHARELAETDELKTLPPPGKDEVGRLYVAFNRLIDRVQQRENEILAFNRSLEAKVAERTRDLAEARDRADQASRSKSEFLANMSHEIRTPINAITGFTALTRRTELDARQSGYLETIDTAAHSLLRIVDDLLDFSKIEAGRLDLERVPFRLADVMNTVVSFVGPLAEKKGLELLLSVARDVPSHFEGDPLRLGQILMNLASNAVKFTQKGEVEVRASLVETAAAGSRLRFAVRDTGIGLTPEQSGKLFQAFTQADTSTTRRFGGTGLGLVICQRLVGLMDGRIWLDSEPGVGTTFSFEVLLASGAAEDAELRGALPTSLRGMPALVVDDNANARHILVEQLRTLGMEARAVPGGEAALVELRDASAAGRPYPVVLMDWRMPGVDGIAATRAIRADNRIAGTPVVIMVTAFGREQPLATAESMNLLDGVLLKPVTPTLMLEALAQAMGAHLSRTDTGAGTAAPGARRMPALTTVPGASRTRTLRLAGARILLVEDHPVNQQLAMELLSQDGAIVTLAEHGRVALDIVEADGAALFDAALVDLQMPEMDGYEFTRRLRERSDGAALPVIAMTAHAMQSERERCLAAGMNDHLSKPIDPEAMIATTAKWIGAEKLAAAARRVPPPAAAAPAGAAATETEPTHASLAALASIDVDGALARCSGNARLLTTLLRELLRRHRDAGAELAALLERADWPALRALAHTLKGSAGNVGARDVSAAAARLESLIAPPDDGRGDGIAPAALASEQCRHQIAMIAAGLSRLEVELQSLAAAAPGSAPETLSGVEGSNAARAAGTTAAEPAQQEAPGRDTLPTSAIAALRTLASRLRESDTRAEQALVEVRAALAGVEPAWVAFVAEAIERLDYAAALLEVDRRVA